MRAHWPKLPELGPSRCSCSTTTSRSSRPGIQSTPAASPERAPARARPVERERQGASQAHQGVAGPARVARRAAGRRPPGPARGRDPAGRIVPPDHERARGSRRARDPDGAQPQPSRPLRALVPHARRAAPRPRSRAPEVRGDRPFLRCRGVRHRSHPHDPLDQLGDVRPSPRRTVLVDRPFLPAKPAVRSPISPSSRPAARARWPARSRPTRSFTANTATPATRPCAAST